MKSRKNIAKMQKFITDWISKNVAVSVVDEPFHEAFHKEFGGKRRVTLYGAQPVAAATRLLKSLYDQGILKRSTVGLPKGSEGFPPWVYCYELPSDSSWRKQC